MEIGPGERKSLLVLGTAPGSGDPRVFTLPDETASGLTVVMQRLDRAQPTDLLQTDTPIWAELTFGSDRVGDAVEVDVERGAAITLPWGVVEVMAHYDTEIDASQPAQVVVASAYAGARNGGIQPTRTKRLGVLLAPAIVEVPPYAATVAVVGLPVADVFGPFGVVLTFLRAPQGRALGQWEVQDPGAIRIPNGTRSIAVQKRGGNPLVSLQFGLCL